MKFEKVLFDTTDFKIEKNKRGDVILKKYTQSIIGIDDGFLTTDFSNSKWQDICNLSEIMRDEISRFHDNWDGE
jgi:hypothetical protein